MATKPVASTLPEPGIMPEPNLVPIAADTVEDSRGNRFKLGASAKAKIALKARLAEEASALKEAEDNQRETVSHLTNSFMRNSAIALINGALTRDELTEILGKAYGFKVTAKNNKPSKTPEGTGNSHRKRIILLAEAGKIAASLEAGLPIVEQDKPKALQGIDNEAIAEIARRCLEQESLSPSMAYKALGELKPRETKPVWQNTNKLGEIIAALSNPDSLKVILENEGLREAFAHIRDLAILAELGECRAMAA
jgi:hypothetical protein